jgi:hypothetical protein
MPPRIGTPEEAGVYNSWWPVAKAKMKLTISRTKGQRGIFKRVMVYQLNVQVDMTREEMTFLVGRHYSYGWEFSVGSSAEDVFIGELYGGDRKQFSARDFVGKTTSWDFETLDALEHVESKLIARMRSLKEGIEALARQEQEQHEYARRLKRQAATFEPKGPREIDL